MNRAGYIKARGGTYGDILRLHGVSNLLKVLICDPEYNWHSRVVHNRIVIDDPYVRRPVAFAKIRSNGCVVVVDMSGVWNASVSVKRMGVPTDETYNVRVRPIFTI